jgi:hypothetical protein
MIKRRHLLFLYALIAVLLIATPCVASSKKAVFSGTVDEVFDAAVKAAQLNWSVKFADRKTGLLTFTTGMSFTSNVGKRIADKFFAAITEQLALGRIPPPAAETK